MDADSVLDLSATRDEEQPEANGNPLMIRHIVFFSARQKDDIPALEAGLRELGRIPFSTIFEVSVNSKVDSIGNDVDVVVYAEFVDQAALDAYKQHPIYAQAITEVRPLRDLRLSADILASPAT